MLGWEDEQRKVGEGEKAVEREDAEEDRAAAAEDEQEEKEEVQSEEATEEVRDAVDEKKGEGAGKEERGAGKAGKEQKELENRRKKGAKSDISFIVHLCTTSLNIGIEFSFFAKVLRKR